MLESGETFSDEALADGTGGVIYSHDDLTINGTGSLTISGGPEHGIEVNDSLVITGGTIDVESTSDGIHVNDAFRFDSADLTVSCGDDAVHCDQEILVAGGSILIEKCNEGIEALTVDIQGGDITIYPSDDGINATDGSTAEMTGGFGGMPQMQAAGEQGRPGEQSSVEAEVEEQNITEAAAEEPNNEETGTEEQSITETSTEEKNTVKESTKEQNTEIQGSEEKTPCVTISGGSVTIINESGIDADGIDSNGDIRITGGKVLVSLEGSGTNSALDYGSEYGGQCFIDGGTVICAGGSSMLEGISAESTQPSVTYVLSETAQAGENVKLSDSEGNVLIEESVPCGQRSGMHGMQQFDEQGQNQETTSAASGTALSEYGSDTRILLAASGIVMLIGLVFAGVFRRRGV